METRGARATRSRSVVRDFEDIAAADAGAPGAVCGGPTCGAPDGAERAATLLAHFTLLLAREGLLTKGDAVDAAAARQLVDGLLPHLPADLLEPCAGACAPAPSAAPAAAPADAGAAAGPAAAAAAATSSQDAGTADPAAPVQLRLHHSCRCALGGSGVGVRGGGG
jgi:hypothetical protein